MYVCMVREERKIDAVIVCCKSNKNVITAMRVVAQLCVHFAFICKHTHTHSYTQREITYFILFSTHYSTITTEPSETEPPRRVTKAFPSTQTQTQPHSHRKRRHTHTDGNKLN